MSMSRKDFNALADSLYELKQDLNKASANGCDNSMSLAFEAHVQRVMELCARHNPAFDKVRFRDAINGD